jgi:dTDP-4-dehydrorhamnose reductase
MAKPRLLVTGGSGYLGRWIVRLAARDWDVTATYRSHPAEKAEGQTCVAWQQLDVRNRAAVEALVKEVQPAVIVHTAASNPGGDTDFEATNEAGTRHIARAAAASRARLVHISSDVIFDGEKGNYVETDLPAPITPYGRSKALAEEEVRASGVEAVIVRTSLIYGWQPRLDRHSRWVVDGLQTGQLPRLFIDELRCPIWVESLAAAVIELAGMEYAGVLNVAGAQVLSRYEFGVRVAQLHGLDPNPIIAARSRESGLYRPLDCTLDCSRARMLLRTPLPGVDEVFSRAASSSHVASSCSSSQAR